MVKEAGVLKHKQLPTKKIKIKKDVSMLYVNLDPPSFKRYMLCLSQALCICVWHCHHQIMADVWWDMILISFIYPEQEHDIFHADRWSSWQPLKCALAQFSKMWQEREHRWLHASLAIHFQPVLSETGWNQSDSLHHCSIALNSKQFGQIPGSGENFKESRRDTVGTAVEEKKAKECESLKVGERQVPLAVVQLLPSLGRSHSPDSVTGQRMWEGRPWILLLVKSGLHRFRIEYRSAVYPWHSGNITTHSHILSQLGPRVLILVKEKHLELFHLPLSRICTWVRQIQEKWDGSKWLRLLEILSPYSHLKPLFLPPTYPLGGGSIVSTGWGGSVPRVL